jgi:acyl-CoA synthetase (AMP-forming)/AMP-acid ligase II/acyl carrier protein
LLSIDELGATVERLGATTMWLTASIFAHVVEAGLPSMRGLRQLLTGGSAGSPQHMVRFLELYPACRLIAGYGPTENTTFSTTFDLSSPAAIGTNPPIGRPIANSSAYVLDDALALVPLGTIGELCVGGDGVAAGYLNLPNETAARFVPDPFALESGALMYRTGDRARMRVDGVIEFLGRTDDQVKINGFRIELGEIEAVLKTHPGVRDAAVVVVERSVGEKSLSAHVVPAVGVDIDEAALRGYLRAKLPAYLVPPRIAIRAALPLHPSGKIDRVALAQSATPVAAARPVAPPQAPSARPSPTQIKRVVSDIWSELLDEAVAPDPHTNFFDAGGDSIRLLRLQTLLNERLAANITVLDLFEFTTIERIATFVANGRR